LINCPHERACLGESAGIVLAQIMETDMKTGNQSINTSNHKTDEGIKSRSGTKPTAKSQTKIFKLARALNRSNGASIGILCRELSWQAHSVRAAISGLRKNGCEIECTKSKSGATVYKSLSGNSPSHSNAVIESSGSAR
jgi:hypothetical protein